jgi:hypothetical protein
MYRRILFVAVLSIVFVAAGVCWVRTYLSPLAEQAARKPEQTDAFEDELPTACLSELAAMDGTATGCLDRPSSNAIAASRKSHDDETDGPSRARLGVNVLRADSADRSRSAANQIHSTEPADSAAVPPNELTDNDAARPISKVLSAEWNTPATRPAASSQAAQSAHTATLPVSVEESLPSVSIDPLRSTDALDLMRRLRSDAEAERTSARRELMRRGFSEVDMELARQLFSPDAEVRKQLALAVPRLASVDAARWLMWLATDPQPEVRLSAITTLATSGDPSLLDKVEALARKDSDQRVKAVADQIAKQHDLAASRGGSQLR